MKEVQHKNKTYYCFDNDQAREQFEQDIYAYELIADELTALFEAYFAAKASLLQKQKAAWDSVKLSLPVETEDKVLVYENELGLIYIREEGESPRS